jgi:hypothetical protein
MFSAKFRKACWQSIIVSLVFVLGLMMPAGAPLAQSSGNPGVIPPNARPHGLTYAAWSAGWWQWAFSLPVNNHPLFDETGIHCGVGQTGHVWYLGGVFNESGEAIRNKCTVPSGTMLFFPILNVVCSSLTGDPPDAIAACAKEIVDTAIELAVEVDGVPIKNLQRYRVMSPLFTYGPLPADNILGAPAGETAPAVADGFYLMLAPLSVGQHTIHFHGTFPDFPFTLDITYILTVAPHGH